MRVTRTNADYPIGVFDSGIGGVSVLRALHKALPHEQFVYFADHAHAPYGEKGDAFVRQRSMAITQQLRDQYGIKALVVACNTATAAAIADVRAAHPDLTIVGIEPALKPAALHSRSKRVAVFATRGTLSSVKFQQLLALTSKDAHFVCQPCDGLAEAIEQHMADLSHPDILRLVSHFIDLAGLNDAQHAVDTVVLGCTHYPLVKAAFDQHLPTNILWVDNGAAVANRLLALLRQHHGLAAPFALPVHATAPLSVLPPATLNSQALKQPLIIVSTQDASAQQQQPHWQSLFHNWANAYVTAA